MRALETLTGINLDDLVSSFGWENRPRLARLLRFVFRAPAVRFARLMLDFDLLVGASSLPEAAAHTLRYFARTLRVSGLDNVPAAGPVLFLSNHPGMVDTLALFTAIRRPDLQIIALRRPFLQSLPNTSGHLYYVSDDAADRLRAVRQAAGHLRQGGAVLTFPAGRIEPDRLVYPGALEALQGWTDSAGVFLRLAPETSLVPVLVSGVLWDRAVKFPLVNFKPGREEREKLGAAFQLLAHILFNARPLHLRLDFAPPLTLAESGSTGLPVIHRLVLERMRGLLSNPPQIPSASLDWQAA